MPNNADDDFCDVIPPDEEKENPFCLFRKEVKSVLKNQVGKRKSNDISDSDEEEDKKKKKKKKATSSINYFKQKAIWNKINKYKKMKKGFH